MDWMLIAERFGIPVAILAVGAAAIGTAVPVVWKAGQKMAGWLAKEVVVKMRDRHFSFLDRIEQTTSRQTDLMAQQSQAIERLGAILDQHTRQLTDHSTKLDIILQVPQK